MELRKQDLSLSTWTRQPAITEKCRLRWLQAVISRHDYHHFRTQAASELRAHTGAIKLRSQRIFRG